MDVIVRRLRYTHPWVHAGVVVFANDTIGVDPGGEPAEVDHDVVVIDVAAEPDGVRVRLEPFLGERATVRRRGGG